MILPTFKLVATLLIAGFFVSVGIVLQHILSQGTNPLFSENLCFNIVGFILGLLYLGIVYLVWKREITTYYEKKNKKRK
jgi:hypothetical protein